MPMNVKSAATALAVATLAVAGVTAGPALASEVPAVAQPTSSMVNVVIHEKLMDKIEEQHLGMRDVERQVARLTAEIEQAMAQNPALAGARANLVLTDLAPNRPTFEQLSYSVGLDPIRSVSIGGASIEGEIVTASGQALPVDYDWYSPSIEDARYASVWQDAERTYERLARRISRGQSLN